MKNLNVQFSNNNLIFEKGLKFFSCALLGLEEAV